MRKSTTFSFSLLLLVLLTALLALPLRADHTVEPSAVTIASDVQQELGCEGDWNPACDVTNLAYDADDDVWQGSFELPAGTWEYKAALNGSWEEGYGKNAGADNIALELTEPTTVKFYYDHKSHWITDNVNSIIATVPGDFQEELGCPEDWQPDCLRSWLQDVDGDGIYAFSTTAIPEGDYAAKVAHNESWDEEYGAGGTPGGDDIPFSVPANATVTFSYDPTTHLLTITSTTDGLEPGDEELVQPPVRYDAANEVVYFVMADRFANGDPANDKAGVAEDDPLAHGYLPENSGYYHGGDLAGLLGKLDYLEDLGVTALWITPQFKNDWVQGDGTIEGSSAGYHGYWQIDYTQIDPHFGTNGEMEALIDAAHDRGMKVYFDIVINHTGDIIVYQEGDSGYISKEEQPYLDANGDPFDDRDFAGSPDFPQLDPEISFPYTPVFPTEAAENAKKPAWLNNPIYYHNRGNSTFSGESSLYGDFFGLDDLFTEHPVVVEGMIDIHKEMISNFDIDGFRVDTVKHVNDELWAEFVPAILEHAAAEGKEDFFVFGEVFDGNPAFTSYFTTELPFPSVLDFGFHGAVTSFAAVGSATNSLADFFAGDDYYTDTDSNAYGLVKFVGNHDIGRLGWQIDALNADASDEERLARAELGHALMFLTRGVPVIYYGDEQGFTGDGGDKDARQDMFPSQVPTYIDDDLIGTEATPGDDNFDAAHPLYGAFGELAALREAHPALRQGAQITRYSTDAAGIFAFSRIDPDTATEYLVVLNNAEAEAGAAFTTASPSTTFTEIYPGTGEPVVSDENGDVTVTVPALGYLVYQAETPIPDPGEGPGISIATPAAGAEVVGDVEVEATIDSPGPVQVTFAVSVDGGDYAPLGTDDNPPYRIFYNVNELAAGTPVTFKAIVQDVAGNLNAAKVSVVVGEEEPPVPPTAEAPYAVIHYQRPDGDYEDDLFDPTDSSTFWGLHLWGDIQETIEWTSPKRFLGEDDYGRFAWVRLQPGAENVGFIVHKGDINDPDNSPDRFFNPSVNPEIWLKQGDPEIYMSQAAAQGYVTIHYQREDGNYDGWGLHLWGDAIDPGEVTDWAEPKLPDAIGDWGAYWTVDLQDPTQPLNFVIHKGDDKDPTDSPDRSFIPAEEASIWLKSGDLTIYPSQGAADNVATIHYHRDDGDYGDYSSNDFDDFWGLHVWEGALAPNPSWSEPLKPDGQDTYGIFFDVPLTEGATQLAYILHRGENKDPGTDQFLVLDKWGYEVWQLEGENPVNPDEPHYVLPILAGAPGPDAGNIDEQEAHWVDRGTILWAGADNPELTYTLHYAAAGGMEATEAGITGSDGSILLEPGTLSDAVAEKFPHLIDLPALQIPEDQLELVPEILKGQIAVSVVDGEGNSVDATGLQIPGVLDDLYTYEGELGVAWTGDVPTLKLWAPTAKSVALHLFADADPATESMTVPMEWDPENGVWSVQGQPEWEWQYYLYEVEVYAPSTGQVETNLVTDPYAHSLSMNSARTQIVDLSDEALLPEGWTELDKPPLDSPEDSTIYELHMRDFSVNDPLVPDEYKGTFMAFTLGDTYGARHLEALADAGLTHIHLLPVFDIATINEDKSEWMSADWTALASYPPDSEEQQALVMSFADEDPFNWGYDPWHYTVPEGSYSTDPDGPARILEFRQMVEALNARGLRVVMDVVYNHTNASGQAEKSVLDRIVPGYYHRLDDKGNVATSTCCANTATEHNMMEKLMIDSLLTWATAYKVDGFRFDLMGHHMKENMLDVRAALDSLTEEENGVDGSDIYGYGEGWNFGEVADDARGINATQLNMGGTGIGTFNDRIRDALRGPGPFAEGLGLREQGFASGLYYDPNDAETRTPEAQLDRLLLLMDQIRVGLAGNLADYTFVNRAGETVTGAEVDYNGAPVGYTEDPQEVINYASAHDNQTLFDIYSYGLPQTTSMDDRVRVQNMGLSAVMLGQGVPFFHAGSDLLRSKSFDRDSYNSGDWFNKIDFTYSSNNFGVGLPPAEKNEGNWPIMQPFLADPALQPAQEDITQMAALYQELLEIRYSSELFRLETEEAIQERVLFHNTGPDQIPGLIVMTVSDVPEPDLDPRREHVIVLFNANDEAQEFTIADLIDADVELHPIQEMSVDSVVATSRFEPATGIFTIPARTTAVFAELQELTVEVRIQLLIEEVEALAEDGTLNPGQANSLTTKLDNALRHLENDRLIPAIQQVHAFLREVRALMRAGILTEEQGRPLIDEAYDIIRTMKYG